MLDLYLVVVKAPGYAPYIDSSWIKASNASLRKDNLKSTLTASGKSVSTGFWEVYVVPSRIEDASSVAPRPVVKKDAVQKPKAKK